VSPEELLTALEGLADGLEIPVSYAPLATEELPARGGLCVLRGERRIILERSLDSRTKVQLLAEGLAQFDLEEVFLRPAIREILDAARAKPHGPSSGRPGMPLDPDGGSTAE
jgi:hypothetical protein